MDNLLKTVIAYIDANAVDALYYGIPAAVILLGIGTFLREKNRLLAWPFMAAGWLGFAWGFIGLLKL